MAIEKHCLWKHSTIVWPKTVSIRQRRSANGSEDTQREQRDEDEINDWIRVHSSEVKNAAALSRCHSSLESRTKGVRLKYFSFNVTAVARGETIQFQRNFYSNSLITTAEVKRSIDSLWKFQFNFVSFEFGICFWVGCLFNRKKTKLKHTEKKMIE